MKFFSFIIVFMFSELVLSSDRIGQARLFLGSTQTSPSELNTELSAQGLKTVDLNNQFGLEITFPVVTYINAGLRYSKHLIGRDELTSTSTTDYQADVDQEVFDFVARMPFFKSQVIMADAVVGVGGSNTKYKMKSASQNGELEKKGSPFATPHALAGVSVAFGYDKFYFVIESGYNVNKVDGFSKTGNINDNVTQMDLSGSYLTLGLLFNGIPIYSK